MVKTQSQHLAAHKAWIRRRDVAKKHLEDLGMDGLREFLGDMHGPILSLSPSLLVQISQGQGRPTALDPSENAFNRVLPPITKRKVPSPVVVIDD